MANCPFLKEVHQILIYVNHELLKEVSIDVIISIDGESVFATNNDKGQTIISKLPIERVTSALQSVLYWRWGEKSRYT